MGDVSEFDSFMSAVIDQKAFDRISGYIKHAKSGPNTKIVAGGGFDDSVGYFIGKWSKCGNHRIFLSFRFYAKSNLGVLEVQNMPFLHI